MSAISVSTREIGFCLIDANVKQYRYRTAWIQDIFMKMSRDSEELMDMLAHLEIDLAKAADENRDNHTVYEITTPEGNRLYVMFTDIAVYFGLSVKEGRW